MFLRSWKGLRRKVLRHGVSLWRTLRLIWAASRRWTAAWFVLLAVQGLVPAAVVYQTKVLVDALANGVGGGLSPEALRAVLGPALLMGGLLLLQELLRGLLIWVRTAQAERMQDKLRARIHRISYQVDLAFYEMPEDHDRLHRARESADTQSLALVDNLGSLLQNAVTLTAIAGVLAAYGLWVPLVLCISMGPALGVALHFNRRTYRWWKQTTPAQRRALYYDWLLGAAEAAAEIRLFRLGPSLAAAYQRLRARLREEQLELIKRQSLAGLGASAFALAVTAAMLAWMGGRLLQGSATLGDLALFYQAFNQGQGFMRTLMGNLGRVYSNSLYLDNLLDFLDLKPQITEVPDPLPVPRRLEEGVRFKDVTFRYPGARRPALKDFNLFLPAGAITAVVGTNGAGKSTLTKLLCRLYDPEAGTLELDGVDLRQFSMDSLRQRLAVLFQQPVHYHETAARNITLNGKAVNGRRVEKAARAAGAHDVISRLERGYATPLGRWFWGGTELSGGEWQRIALARAFFRQAPLVVLDEPTSFMDSWAEADWLERFRQLMRGRTALLITHRFTTARYADVIHVMHEGSIVESGTHEELLARGGRYAQSWEAQVAGPSSLVHGENDYHDPPGLKA